MLKFLNLKKEWIACALLGPLVFIACRSYQSAIKKDPVTGRVIVNTKPSAGFLTPAQSLKSFVMQKGYKMQLVASEPMISEPVAIVWDGNGSMYVAEMNTYMQDADGSGQDQRTCKIKKLDDTDGDGVMDKASVFIDSLLLPRMILTLDDRLLVNETYSNNIYSYRDTKGTGHADEKVLVYSNNDVNKVNLEHQKSGFVWNMDNRIYITKEELRYKYVNGKLEAETLYENPGGQWGVASDDYGRLFFSAAGGETPALNFQQNPFYGRIDFKDQYSPEFLEPWPIISTPDVQGGPPRLRPDSTLNHFTACSGQSIYRGDRLPADLRGDYILCEPVGRLIRRAKVTNTNAKITMENAYDKQEFIASTDMNFRPINSTTGPDGCLYIVDMHRGIIQETTWVPKGGFLRKQILARGLEKNIGRGRIYRVVYDGIKPEKLRPDLLRASGSKLVSYLSHSNGWWRDNAQKLMVVRGDKSVVPALKKLAAESKNPLAKIHALWTLDGLGSVDQKTLFDAFRDPDAQVRKAAVWISEAKMKTDQQLISRLEPLKDDASADVRLQLALSLRFNGDPRAQEMVKYLVKNYPGDETLIASNKKYTDGLFYRKKKEEADRLLKETDKKLVSNGAVIFKGLCATCHGGDGKGISNGGKDMPAPPLAGSANVNGDPEKLIRILLHGLSGPVNGNTYADVMPALGSNNDEYIASVLSYIRNDLGNKAATITVADVKKVRALTAGRTSSWTVAELNAIKPAAPVKK
ncbi:MAG: c-type cytochrome [Bacteroidota bacterium]